MTSMKQEQPTNERPFCQLWLNSCYQQTLLPGAPWHKFEYEIARHLAKKVEKQFSHPDRKEALLEVLGYGFVEDHMPEVKRQPQLLEPPLMTGEERHQLIVEAQSWLNSQMYKVIRESGFQKMLTGAAQSDEPVPPGYAEFLQHSFGVFLNGLDRELCLQEQELAKKKKEDLKSRKKGLKDEYFKVPAPSSVKPVSVTSTETKGSSKPSTRQIKLMVHKVEGDPPPLWGSQSDAVGSSVVAILERDPRKFEHVAGRLHGRQLPGLLRSFMWADVLFREERKKMKEVNVEKIVRERFAHAVTRGLSELRLKRATQSPINGLIENAVIETYTKTTSMVNHKSGDHMKETARVLNVLYVYDRSYEPYIIHWLFPLQIAFRNGDDTSSDKGEHVFALAMYLDLLNASCFPTWPQVFAIAEKVMNTLKQTDPELHDHLRHIALINVKVNPKEFLVHLIHEEKAKAEALLKATPGTVKAENMSTELLADPLIFFRRWIGEGFVSVLDAPAVLYVWDQCFMQGWKHSVLQNFCIALVELLRHKFMEAKDYVEMKDVFLNEPCKLYTCDIQIAWIHTENGKDLSEIPYQNRQRPLTPSSNRTPSVVSSPFLGQLQSFGIKEITAKLIVPSEAMKKENWLANVDPHNLKFHTGVYFGSIKLRSRMSLSSVQVTSVKTDTYGNVIYMLTLPQEKFVFENLDLSQYDVERELGAYPYAILKLEYRRPELIKGKTSLAVGWARIPLFRRTGSGTHLSIEPVWTMMAGSQNVTLHPGEIPDTFLTTHPKTPSERADDSLIGYNSELSAVVYDPRSESPELPQPFIQMPQVPPTDTRSPSVHISPRKDETPGPSPVQAPTPLDEDHSPWVPHKPAAIQTSEGSCSNTEPFDLYIDGVRFIPDNASIVKVTGRVLKTGALGELPDILAIPDLDSPARCPLFHYRLPINLEKKAADPSLMILLRVYTVDIVTNSVVVVGSCLFGVFDINQKSKKGSLRVGGYQLRVRSGVPEMKQGIAGLKSTDLDGNAAVPGCSILIRLLPYSEEPVVAPKYSVGYYKSETCRPTTSEHRIFESYKDHVHYPRSEKDMVKRLQEAEGIAIGHTDSELLNWLKNRLDIKKQLPANQPAANLALARCVRYRIKTGLNIKINQAFGLPDGYVIHCLSRVCPGGKVLGMEATKDGYGKEEKFITLKHIFESLLQAPAWADEPKEVHPFYDRYSCLLIQMFGLQVVYKPRRDHQKPGDIMSVDGSELELTDDSILGWTVVPLFEGNSVLTGTHHVPVFKGKPTVEILEELTKGSAQSVLEQHNLGTNSKYNAASVVVTIWDAHYDFQEIPEMPVYEHLLEVVGDLEAYRAAHNLKTGRHINGIVIDSLEPKHRKQGTKSQVYQKELNFFESVITKKFYDLMESAMMNAGYGPL